jgi:hypothetical protein
MSESSNIVVLKPEVADAFPDDEAVNSALLSLIDLAQRTAGTAGARRPAPRTRARSGQREPAKTD